MVTKKGEYKPAIPRKLTAGDKEFIKLLDEGSKKVPAFRQSYPEHPLVVRYHQTEKGTPERHKIIELLVGASKSKLQTQYMRRAIMSYQDSMEEFSRLAVDTAIELVQGAKSEKVRADLAIEGIRHKIGTPVQKVAVQEKKTVTLSFGPAPKEDIIDLQPTEVIKEAVKKSDVLDDIFN